MNNISAPVEHLQLDLGAGRAPVHKEVAGDAALRVRVLVRPGEEREARLVCVEAGGQRADVAGLRGSRELDGLLLRMHQKRYESHCASLQARQRGRGVGREGELDRVDVLLGGAGGDLELGLHAILLLRFGQRRVVRARLVGPVRLQREAARMNISGHREKYVATESIPTISKCRINT